MEPVQGRIKILICNVCNTDKTVRPYRHKDMQAYLCEDCSDLTWKQVYDAKNKNQLLKRLKEKKPNSDLLPSSSFSCLPSSPL